MTCSVRTRLCRGIGLALALGLVIAPSAFAKPYVGDSSGGSSPRSAPNLALSHDTWGGDARLSAVVADQLPCTPQCATTVGASNGNGTNVSTPVTKQAGITATSGSHEARDVLLAASASGLLLIGGGLLVLTLRRRRAQPA